MKKYTYTIEVVTASIPNEREEYDLAEALHRLILESATECGEEVYAKVSFQEPIDVNDEELTQFKKDAGYN